MHAQYAFYVAQVFDEECEEFENESLYDIFFGQLKVSLKSSVTN